MAQMKVSNTKGNISYNKPSNKVKKSIFVEECGYLKTMGEKLFHVICKSRRQW
jgi:hypothetical protein